MSAFKGTESSSVGRNVVADRTRLANGRPACVGFNELSSLAAAVAVSGDDPCRFRSGTACR